MKIIILNVPTKELEMIRDIFNIPPEGYTFFNNMMKKFEEKKEKKSNSSRKNRTVRKKADDGLRCPLCECKVVAGKCTVCGWEEKKGAL
jgi:hypothetical protein